MAGLCFYFEPEDIDVWSGKNLDAWNYAAKVAGDIDKMIVVNKTSQDIPSPDKSIDFKVVSDLPDLDRACYLTPPWHDGISMWEFDHDADWYVFGPASGWRSRPGDNMVVIPQAGQGAVHSVHAATAVMFHRYYVRNK